MSNHVEKPKRASDKRKRRPLARWHITVVVVITTFIAVWSINAFNLRAFEWQMTQTIEGQKSILEETEWFQTAMSIVVLTQTADAPTRIVRQTEWMIQYQTEMPIVVSNQALHAPTEAIFIATAASFFESSNTEQAKTVEAILATQPPMYSNDEFTATAFTAQTTQTAYVMKLELDLFYTVQAPTWAVIDLTKTAFAPTEAILVETANAFIAPNTTLSAAHYPIDEFAQTATMFVVEFTKTAYLGQLETQAALTASAATPEATTKP